jgi:hypothetical protein
MKKVQQMKKSILGLAICGAAGLGLMSSIANAQLLDWQVNFEDANAILGGNGVAGYDGGNSILINKYNITAESLVLFNDNDTSGNISAGDTFQDFIFYRINALESPDGNNTDDRYALNQFQITGMVYGAGVQTSDNEYVVTDAAIGFNFDAPSSCSSLLGSCGGGTLADWANLGTFIDGEWVQYGIGGGTGGNTAQGFPNGNIDLFFGLFDLLSTESCGEDEFCSPLELFDNPNYQPDPELGGPVGGSFLANFLLRSDTDNTACQTVASDGSSADIGGVTNECNSTVSGIAATWNAFAGNVFPIVFENYDFGFQTISNGSAIKTAVPNPATAALLGIGILAGGLARRRKQRNHA